MGFQQRNGFQEAIHKWKVKHHHIKTHLLLLWVYYFLSWQLPHSLLSRQPLSWFTSLNLHHMKLRSWRSDCFTSLTNLSHFPLLQRKGHTIRGTSRNCCPSALRKEWSFSQRAEGQHGIHPRQMSCSGRLMGLPSIKKGKLTCCGPNLSPKMLSLRNDQKSLHREEWPLQDTWVLGKELLGGSAWPSLLQLLI